MALHPVMYSPTLVAMTRRHVIVGRATRPSHMAAGKSGRGFAMWSASSSSTFAAGTSNGKHVGEVGVGTACALGVGRVTQRNRQLSYQARGALCGPMMS